MKKKIFTIGLVIMGISLNAQVSDSVALGTGYANESYYSLESGEVANVANNNWDLAFDMSGFGATIRVNRLTELYLYPGGIGDWEGLDTAGIEGWTRYYNSDVSWSFGALNAPADPGEPTDLGWGEYNTTTHFTDGSHFFVVKLQSGNYKKLFIRELGMGVYTFEYDFLDNSDFTEAEVAKGDYEDQNFIHYSLDTKEIVSREPNTDQWDIVFSNYHSEVAPGVYYGVTGALSNLTVEIQQVESVPSDEATFVAGEFDSETNVIGHDWKSFNLETYTYDIADSLTYFVYSSTYDVWKLVFTGFNGSSDGKIYFTKELVSASGIEENVTVAVTTYPNPAVNELNIIADGEINTVNLYGMNGQLVYSNADLNTNTLQLDISAMEIGVYVMEIKMSNGTTQVQKIIFAD